MAREFPFTVIDNSENTFYKSLTLPTTGNPKQLVFRLWENYGCNKVNLKAVEGIGPREVQIQTSTDGTNYSTVASTTLNNTNDWQTINFSQTDARFVRIRILSSYGAKNVGINEVQIFGSPK